MRGLDRKLHHACQKSYVPNFLSLSITYTSCTAFLRVELVRSRLRPMIKVCSSALPGKMVCVPCGMSKQGAKIKPTALCPPCDGYKERKRPSVCA